LGLAAFLIAGHNYRQRMQAARAALRGRDGPLVGGA
jgi:hypothetical protein